MKQKAKKVFVMLVALFSLASHVCAQSKGSISGTVYDNDGDTPLAGATVALKGTTVGTMTDFEGKYTLNIAVENPVLVFRMLGYATQEIPVGGRSVINVTLLETSQELEEVVVTALGITRAEKSLGYAVSKLDNTELTNTVSSNWMNAMQGKIAGLTFDQAGSGPGGAMRVTLRGENSLNHGANGVLFVVDGTPINSGTVNSGSGSNYANVDAPVDFGNGSSEINPDDIESISVLKGAAATALYGSRAGNGAIIITTKSGKKEKGFGVTINSSVTFEQAGFWPDFQTEYGSGSDMGLNPFNFWVFNSPQTLPDGATVTGSNYSRYAFGERFDSNKYRYQYNSKNWETGVYTPTPWEYQDDWYTGIFRTGVTYNNSVSIEGNNGSGTTSRISITNTENEWILPNTGYRQTTVALTLNTEMNKYMTLRAKVNYMNKGSDNLPINGYNESGALYNLVWGFNSNSINEWKDEYFNGRFNYNNWTGNRNVSDGGYALVYPVQTGYNPYRTLYEELNGMDKDRVFGNAALSIKLHKNLALDLRSGVDLISEFRTQRKPYYTTGRNFGFYREQSYQDYELNNDFLLRYTNNNWVDKRLGASVSFGGNMMYRKYRQQRVTLAELEIEDVYNVNNIRTGTDPIPYNYRYAKKVHSLYGVASLSWDDTYYLDITGRNDWSSTLSPENWSFFYPSISTSILLNNVFDLSSSQIDLLKLRLSWANVGNDTDAYALYPSYSNTYYSAGFRLPGTIPDPNIEPENVASWEGGFEVKLFRNRLGFDFAAYHTSSTMQIVSVSTDWISGASGWKMNAGEIQNKGLEISFNAVPVQTRDFTWSMNFNWSKNWNKLVKLQDDWDPNTPFQTNPGTTIGSRTFIYSYLGEEMNVIYGKGFQKAPEGSFYTDENGVQVDCSGMDLVDASTGYPMLDDQPTTRIGKVNPDWRAGMSQRFSYKNLTLSTFFSAQWGGNTFSVTNFSLSYQGKLKNSLAGRNDGLVHGGVNETVNSDGTITYTKNKAVTSSIQTYYNTLVWVRDNTANNTFDTSFLKFKEARLDYMFPKSLLGKTNVLQGASIGAYMTNIFCLSNFPQYDPEAGMMSGNDIYRGIEAMTFPMTRTYGINVKLSF